MTISEMPEAGTLTIEPLPLETAVDLTKHRNLIPAAESLSALGIAIAELSKTATTTPGGPGLYRVTFPAGANGVLAQAKDGTGFLGAIVGGRKLDQARLTPVTVNPAMLAVSLALVVVTQQLHRIEKTQQEILAFLEQDKESTTVGHLHVLGELTRNLTHQRGVEYRTAALTQAQTAKGYAVGSIDFYRNRVKAAMQRRKRIQTGRDVAATMSQLEPAFVQYRAALRLYAHATMLEVVLVSNRDHDYLDGMRQALEERAHHYRELYTSCSVALEQGRAGVIGARAAGGVAMATGATGRAIGRMPLISRGQVDEALIAAEAKIGNVTGAATGRTVQRFAGQKEPGIGPFLEAIVAMDRVYNEPVTLLADAEGVFVEPSMES